MRRSHRLALSAACAFAMLLAAGRLATSAPSRAGVASEATVASATRDGAREPTAASHAGPAARLGDGGIEGAADAHVATSVQLESTSERVQRSRGAGSAHPIVLDDPQTALGGAVAIHGRDPAGPRAIELWRLVGSRTARIAIGHSRGDGTLELPALVLPAGEVVLVASPRGAGPNAAAASEAVRVMRDPSPPRLVAREETRDSSGSGALLSLQLEPAEPGGEIVVVQTIAGLDAQTTQLIEFARLPVVAAADGARATLDLVVTLQADDTEVGVAQELADGRRSPWRRLVLDFQPEGNGNANSAVENGAP